MLWCIAVYAYSSCKCVLLAIASIGERIVENYSWAAGARVHLMVKAPRAFWNDCRRFEPMPPNPAYTPGVI